MTVRILVGNSLDRLRELPDESVHCIVTSPPYYGLRDYGVSGQIGLEPSPQEFIDVLVEVFREARRVLHKDGTCWVNMGDSYASNAGGYSATGSRGSTSDARISLKTMSAVVQNRSRVPASGLKQKDLMGIPWWLAFALRADGWWLRQEIIWHKPNPMPESIKDRCTKSHEHIFLLTKSERYFFDGEAIAEEVAESTIARLGQPSLENQEGSDRVPGKTNGKMKAVPPRFGGNKYGNSDDQKHRTKSGRAYSFKRSTATEGMPGAPDQHRPDRDDIEYVGKRNKRSVWTVATSSFKEAHFATFPPALIEPCIKAGCPRGGVVLDPFLGAGTTGLVADRLQRDCIGIELNPEYAELARKRIQAESPLLAEIAAE